jgi:drug/metabolite transporter (DMT)-like permease
MRHSLKTSTQAGVATVLLTIAAMLAFAANSLLSRFALGEQLIDAASFTTVRVASGALTLVLIALPRRRTGTRASTDWRAVATLFVYTIFFSFAYISLSAGTGALILFGAVQLTMFVVALRDGEYFSLWSWAGLVVAIMGLIYLVSPGVTAPDPLGAVLMAVAGVAWGGYSLLGKGATDPLATTTSNFVYSVPLVIISSLLFLNDFQISLSGVVLAIASGTLASGIGYVAWYAALRDLTATHAATVQLSVPVIAAFGGVTLLSEPISLRLIVASAATLGGVAIVLTQYTARHKQSLKLNHCNQEEYKHD